MKTKIKKWKKVSSKIVLDDPYLRVHKDVVRLPNGKRLVYHVMNKGNRAATILPIDRQGKILIKKEFRYPVGEVIYDSVGGKIDKNETPLQAAKRELKEETGYTARSFVFLGSFYGNPSRSPIVFYVYLATGLRAGSATPDNTEFVETEFLPKKKFEQLLRQGVIKEPFLMSGYLLYLLKK